MIISGVKCSLKANDGVLYPLEKSFLFIHKPSTYIPFEDISAVEFSRVNSTNQSGRTFDFILHLKNNTEVTFTSIQRYVFYLNFVVFL